jgi:hypothetical protein
MMEKDRAAPVGAAHLAFRLIVALPLRLSGKQFEQFRLLL